MTIFYHLGWIRNEKPGQRNYENVGIASWCGCDNSLFRNSIQIQALGELTWMSTESKIYFSHPTTSTSTID
jgi:hypothetical protein